MNWSHPSIWAAVRHYWGRRWRVAVPDILEHVDAIYVDQLNELRPTLSALRLNAAARLSLQASSRNSLPKDQCALKAGQTEKTERIT